MTTDGKRLAEKVMGEIRVEYRDGQRLRGIGVGDAASSKNRDPEYVEISGCDISHAGSPVFAGKLAVRNLDAVIQAALVGQAKTHCSIFHARNLAHFCDAAFQKILKRSFVSIARIVERNASCNNIRS